MFYFVIVYRFRPDNPRLETVRVSHQEFLEKLAASNRLVAAGPLTDPAGGELLVVRFPTATDTKTVLSLTEKDPLVREGLITQRDVRQWRPDTLNLERI